jgi:hypothetical protein
MIIMKTIRVFIFVLLFLHPLLLRAQEQKKINNFKMGIEYGIDSYLGELALPERIRESNDNGYGIFLIDNFISIPNIDAFYLGVKPEFFFYKNRLGISSGIRFSCFSNTLNPKDNYFFWLLKQEDVRTDYVRILSIKQKSYFIGIPLEIRFFPMRWDSFFQYYIKFGASLNYKVLTHCDIRFHEPAMQVHAQTVEDQFSGLSLFNSYIYPAFGLKFGKPSSPWLNMEVHFPGILIDRQVTSFYETGIGIGVQFSVQIPIGKSAPIGSE